MSSYAALAGLFVAAGSLFLLPLIPAFLELQHKTDAQPLSVIQKHAGDIRYFADSFRGYIKELEPALHESASTGETLTGTLPDATEYMVLGSGVEGLRLPFRQHDEICPVLIAAATDLSLPANTTFSKDIYSGGRFLGGEKSKYRAILGEKEVQLGANSHVMRWVHAVGEFVADSGCELRGRVSSEHGIQLHHGCSFQRLNAPRIEFGGDATPELNVTAAQESPVPTRLLHDGDFEIPPNESFHGNLVVRGILRVGSGATVRGSIKGDAGVVVESGAVIAGSLISSGPMQIGPGCAVHGPVIAETSLVLKSGSRCGSATDPTTVSAPWIQVEEGVAVFGTLWARERGEVLKKL